MSCFGRWGGVRVTSGTADRRGSADVASRHHVEGCWYAHLSASPRQFVRSEGEVLSVEKEIRIRAGAKIKGVWKGGSVKKQSLILQDKFI